MYLMKYKDGHAYSTLEIMVRSLSSFYNIILDELQLVDMVNPMVGIKLPKRKEEQEHHMVLVKDEVMALIHNAKNIREKAMLMFMFNTGVRFCEISNVTLDMYLNRDSNNAIDLVITKGMKPRTVYLSENTCKVIDKYIADMRKMVVNICLLVTKVLKWISRAVQEHGNAWLKELDLMMRRLQN